MTNDQQRPALQSLTPFEAAFAAEVTLADAALRIREASTALDEARRMIERLTQFDGPIKQRHAAAPAVELASESLKHLSGQTYWLAESIRNAGSRIVRVAENDLLQVTVGRDDEALPEYAAARQRGLDWAHSKRDRRASASPS